MTTAVELFRAAMRVAGLDFAGSMHSDGKLHRFRAEGDKARNSWYVLHAGPPMAGAFGCWRRGIQKTWCAARNANLTQAERDGVRERWQEAERERERIEAERHAKARCAAAWILARSKPADASHAYLMAKGVGVHGDLRELRGALVVPSRDVKGELHSLQFIAADSAKRFLTGGRVSGCCFTVADEADGPLVVCEGYATGASVHEATGFATVAAMNCGNLKVVSETLRVKWPEREIIIAADHDVWTDGNPGLTKATEAANAICARLAVPQFADVSTKPTDFNDLQKLAGPAEVKRQIEAAEAALEDDDDLIARLATLAPLVYERQREEAAQKLGCRPTFLDKLVDGKRRKPKTAEEETALQGRAVSLPDVELWPEPVDGAAVLAAIAETFSRYVALPDGAADVLALWVAHAHSFDAFSCSPRLNISSPEKGCGKTTLRDVVAAFVSRPVSTENITTAVLFRLVQAHSPTILADECDAWLKDNEELRGLLNAGHRRGGQFLRCEGDDHEVRGFRVFGPAVLCGIGALPGTLHDRSIVIRLERAKPGELRERFDSRRTQVEQELCRKLARWCADNKSRLEVCDPVLPAGAFNRLADNWRPLFAIAELVGDDWPRRVAAAFVGMTRREDADAQGLGVMLLVDIRQAFAETSADRLFSRALVAVLIAMSDRPWPEAHRGKPITETWLARRLKSFGVHSRKLRLPGEAAKQGYYVEDFREVFQRYLPEMGETKWNSGTTLENKAESPLSEVEQPESLFHFENSIPPNKDTACSTVPLQNAAKELLL